MILLDTSGLLAAVDASQTWHREAATCLAAASPPRLMSPFVLAELDHLLAVRVGEPARVSVLGEIERGAYTLAPLSGSDVGLVARSSSRMPLWVSALPTPRSSCSPSVTGCWTC